MAFTRRSVTKDAIWARAWTADAVADLTSIAAIAGPNGPRHGDIAFVTATSNYYLWLDNSSWAQITEIAETDGANIFNDLDAIDLRRAGTVRVGLRNTSAGADLKQWYIRVSGVVFQLQTVDDVGSSPVVLVESDRNGNLTLTGNIAAFAGQIGFPATQNPSAGANVLDDYEENVWTIADGSGAGLALTVVQSGVYTKIGNWLQVQAAVTYPITADVSAQVFSGLPFTVRAGHTPSGAIGASDIGVQCTLVGNAGTTTMSMLDATTGANKTNAQCSGKTFFLTLGYLV